MQKRIKSIRGCYSNIILLMLYYYYSYYYVAYLFYIRLYYIYTSTHDNVFTMQINTGKL